MFAYKIVLVIYATAALHYFSRTFRPFSKPSSENVN